MLTSHCNLWGNTAGDYIGMSPDPADISADPEYCPDLDNAYRISLDNSVGVLERLSPCGDLPLAAFQCPMVVGEDYLFLVSALGGSLEGWYGTPGEPPSTPQFAVKQVCVRRGRERGRVPWDG